MKSGMARSLFSKFFLNHFWVGLVVCLVTILIEKSVEKPSFIQISAFELFKTIGISVMVASIFTFAAGSSDFMKHIQTLLERVVTQRSFLGNLDRDSKKRALETLLQPSDQDKGLYSKINVFYRKFIDEAFSIYEKPIREKFSINCVARYSEEKRKIIVSSTYSYTLYKNSEGFDKIPVGFEKGEEESTVDRVRIVGSKGNVIFNEENITLSKLDSNGARIGYVEIPQEGFEENELCVTINMTEVGGDHWCLLTFNNLHPTNGFDIKLHCNDDIEIRKYAVFFVNAECLTDASPDKKGIHIATNQWITEGTGLTILISSPHGKGGEVYSQNAVNIAETIISNSSKKSTF